jgi:hypothetical protein
MASLFALGGEGQENELRGDPIAYVDLLGECVDLALVAERTDARAEDRAEAHRQALMLVRRSLSGLLQAVRLPSEYAERKLWEQSRTLLHAC